MFIHWWFVVLRKYISSMERIMWSFISEKTPPCPSIIFTCQQGIRCEGTRMKITYSKKQVTALSQISQELFVHLLQISYKLSSLGESEDANESTLQTNADHKLWEFLSVGLESWTLCLGCNSFLSCSLTSNEKYDISRCSESFCNNSMLCQCTSRILQKR